MKTIQNRFEKTSFCHPNTSWEWVQKQLDEQPQLLSVIEKMEASDGEVIVLEFNDDVYFVDGYQETPKSRANVCFDLAARCARKKFSPQSSAQEMVSAMGTSLVSVAMYQHLQSLMDVDCKTSSWLQTPASIRQLNGALFGDKRYNTTFIYHNGADAHYGVRGFRSYIKIGSIQP